MEYKYGEREIKREAMIEVKHEGMAVNMTLCTETELDEYKCNYYEIKFSEGEDVIYLLNHTNINRAFNEADRLRKCLLIGRVHA